MAMVKSCATPVYRGRRQRSAADSCRFPLSKPLSCWLFPQTRPVQRAASAAFPCLPHRGKGALCSEEFSDASSWLKSCSPVVSLRSVTGGHARSRSSAGSSTGHGRCLQARVGGVGVPDVSSAPGPAYMCLCRRVCSLARSPYCFLASRGEKKEAREHSRWENRRASPSRTQPPALVGAHSPEGTWAPRGVADSGGGTA